jgi:hypothetical protein
VISPPPASAQPESPAPAVPIAPPSDTVALAPPTEAPELPPTASPAPPSKASDRPTRTSPRAPASPAATAAAHPTITIIRGSRRSVSHQPVAKPPASEPQRQKIAALPSGACGHPHRPRTRRPFLVLRGRAWRPLRARRRCPRSVRATAHGDPRGSSAPGPPSALCAAKRLDPAHPSLVERI